MGGKGKGGGSSGGSTQNVQGNQPPSWLMPYISQYLQLGNYLTTGNAPTAAQEKKYWGGNAPSTTQYPGPNLQVAGLNSTELAGLGGLNSSASAQDLLSGQASSTANSILQGKNLDPSSNPGLAAYYNAAVQPLTNQYNAATAPSNMSQAALSGAFGGSADAENRALSQYGFGNQLQNLAANIYEPAYEQGLNQQTSVLGMSPELTKNLSTGANTLLESGGIQQQQSQAELNANYQNQYNKSMWPYQMEQMLGGMLGTAGGGSGMGMSQSTQNAGSSGKKGNTSQSIGSLASLASLAAMFFA